MELTYKDLKEAIEEFYSFNDGGEITDAEEKLLIAAKEYLPILLKQEFIKPNEDGNTDK